MEVKFDDYSVDYQKYMKSWSRLNGAYTKVGFPNNGDLSGDKKNLLVSVAVWNEFGTSRAPARPFMKQTTHYAATRAELTKLMRSVAVQVQMKRIEPRQGLSKIGAFFKGEIQKTIDRQDFTPLSQYTINRKGSSKILIDTATMKNGIKHVEVLPEVVA